MGSTAAVVSFTLLAVVELVADQLPSTPSRTRPPGLIARIVLGRLSGAAVAAPGIQSIALGAGFGVAGGIAGASGYEVRILVKALEVPAVLEDGVAIAGAVLVVSPWPTEGENVR